MEYVSKLSTTPYSGKRGKGMNVTNTLTSPCTCWGGGRREGGRRGKPNAFQQVGIPRKVYCTKDAFFLLGCGAGMYMYCAQGRREIGLRKTLVRVKSPHRDGSHYCQDNNIPRKKLGHQLSFITHRSLFCLLGKKNLKLFLAFFVFLYCHLQHTIHNTWNNYKAGSAETSSRSNPVIFAKLYNQINKISHCIFCAQDIFFTLKMQS